MAEKKKVCKSCGFLTLAKECENCGGKVLLEKFKGQAVILDEKSIVAEKLGVESKGQFALKYG